MYVLLFLLDNIYSINPDNKHAIVSRPLVFIDLCMY